MTPLLGHAVFGGVLASSSPFPELRPAPLPGDWHVLTAACPSPLGPLLGEAPVQADCRVRLHAQPEGALALVFDDTGRFEITADGRTIRWDGPASADPLAVRTDVLGRALPAALHRQGRLVLHASGLVIGGSAIALVAPSGTGKSSLAFALVQAGARLLGDDALPVLVEDGAARAWPGVHSVRVRDDTAAAVAGDARFERHLGGKREYRSLPEAMLATAAAPLAAIYVLVPAPADAPAPIEVTPLPAPVAVPVLLGQQKLGALLGGAEAPVVLARTAALVRAVPVLRLAVARDLARLPAAAAALAARHGA